MGVGARRPTRETPEERQLRTELARRTKLANDARRRVDADAAADYLIKKAGQLAPLGPAQRERVVAALSASALPAPGGGLSAAARRSGGGGVGRR